MIQNAQPSMIAALQLQNDINKTNSLLGFYMLNKTEAFSQNYKQSLDATSQSLDKFIQVAELNNDSHLKELSANLQTLLAKYNQHQIKLDKLTVDFISNYPAIKLANEVVNPIYKEVSQSFTLMTDSEFGEGLNNSRKKILYTIISMRNNWATLVTTLRTFLANPNDARISELQSYIDLHYKLEKELAKHSDDFTFEQEEGYMLITEKAPIYFNTLQKIFDIFKANQWRKDIILIREDFSPLIAEISKTVDEIIQYQSKQILNSNNELTSVIEQTQSLLIVLFIVAVIIGIFVAKTNSNQVTTIVNEVNETLGKMSSGDFSTELNEDRAGEVGTIAKTINIFSDKLKNMMADIQDSINNLHNASSKLSTSTQQTTKDINKQHLETESIASAIEEMSATAQEIASNVTSAADSANHANNKSKSGQQVSNTALSGINSLVTNLNETSDVIKQLQNESENISVVLDVINTISEQTNLLALNAAIEAARAGEQGRGFAVVADEVRTLAGRTQESTEQIKDNIDKLQSQSSNAVEAMDSAIEMVSKNSEQVNEVAEALSDIANEISNINAVLNQMAGASKQQSDTANEISQNVSSISELAERSAQGSKQIENAEEDLRQVSQKLDNIISNFKI